MRIDLNVAAAQLTLRVRLRVQVVEPSGAVQGKVLDGEPVVPVALQGQGISDGRLAWVNTAAVQRNAAGSTRPARRRTVWRNFHRVSDGAMSNPVSRVSGATQPEWAEPGPYTLTKPPQNLESPVFLDLTRPRPSRFGSCLTRPMRTC